MNNFPTKLFINGEFRPPAGDKRLRLINPANEEVITDVQAADTGEINGAVSGESEAGLSTTELPAARAGATFQQAIGKGKFQGTIAATTPRGWRRVKSNPPRATGMVWP